MNTYFFKKTIAIYSIIVIALLGLHIFVFLKIKNYNQSIASFENELIVQKDRQEKMFYMNQIIDQNKTEIDLIKNSVVSKNGNVEFIETMESLAKNNNLSIEIQSLSFEPDPTLNKDEMVFFKIKALTKGSWINIYTFLSQIEALPFSIRVDNMAAVSSSSDSQNGIKSEWQMTLDIRVLKYK
ncbi:MAG: hypothetical protein WC095_01160 [Candidatus Paceibacterota bacterium]